MFVNVHKKNIYKCKKVRQYDELTKHKTYMYIFSNKDSVFKKIKIKENFI